MKHKNITILGIESSCDETSAAVIRDGKILANIIATQKIHEAFGGVVPELASRAHQVNIVPAVDTALKKASITVNDIDAIAYTRGPGLMGALLVGASFAKSMALALNIPLIEVHHMQAHVLAHFIDDEEQKQKPEFPFICLTVSGGHTQIVRVNDYLKMEIIGETIDDAAGEAFDKVAKLLHLPYPGGPWIDKLAQQGNPEKFVFPHPQIKNLDFSFSGLKTSVLYFLQHELLNNPNFIEENKADICASVQKTIVEILLSKLQKAAKQTGINTIALAGGVSANSGLRKGLLQMAEKNKWKVFIPKFEYCTDNAAMIAITGYYKYLNGEFGAQNHAPLARYEF
ncbi:MAG: tRNA (adenosine(37)-N6)-threonylcarbamoyltransferase complex transferase subunit TsaD [Bacteroidia bacterium]